MKGAPHGDFFEKNLRIVLAEQRAAEAAKRLAEAQRALAKARAQ